MVPRARIISALLLATALMSLQTASMPTVAAEQVSAPRLYVVVEKGLLTVEARDAHLTRILRLVGEQAGVAVRFLGDPHATVTLSFKKVPLEEGLRRLLKGHSLVLVYAPSREGGDRALAEVVVVASSSAARGGARAAAEPTAAGSADAAGLGLGAGPGLTGGADSSKRNAQTAEQTHGAAGDLAPQPGAAADLARTLAENPNPLVRSQAAALLGIAGGEPAATALAGALADDDPAVRLHAVRALGKVEGVQAVPALESVLQSDLDPRVRQVAVRWLGALPGAAARAALKAAESDPDPTVRAEVDAVRAIWGKRGR